MSRPPNWFTSRSRYPRSSGSVKNIGRSAGLSPGRSSGSSSPSSRERRLHPPGPGVSVRHVHRARLREERRARGVVPPPHLLRPRQERVVHQRAHTGRPCSSASDRTGGARPRSPTRPTPAGPCTPRSRRPRRSRRGRSRRRLRRCGRRLPPPGTARRSGRARTGSRRVCTGRRGVRRGACRTVRIGLMWPWLWFGSKTTWMLCSESCSAMAGPSAACAAACNYNSRLHFQPTAVSVPK